MGFIPSKAEPSGIGILKVVKQALEKYRPGEVAHIENVMAHESKSREHRRLHQVETGETFESEHLEESQHDLQSAERFELQSETSRSIKSETLFNAGVEVSGGFGPVKVSSFAKFASGNSATEATKNASKFAKETIERSVAKVLDKVRQERTVKTLDLIEEKNTHGFNNETGEHSSAIFCWVDKYYRTRVVDYGKRLFYEFVVPEPAAYFLHAMRRNYMRNVLPEKPKPPVYAIQNGQPVPLEPHTVTEWNYRHYLAQYNVTGVAPPPADEAVITRGVTKEIPASVSSAKFSYTVNDIKIPAGYEAFSGEITFDTDTVPLANITIGSGIQEFIPLGYGKMVIYNPPPQASATAFYQDHHFICFFKLRKETDILPVTVKGYTQSGTHRFSIRILCKLSKEAYAKWQLNTYAAIMNAYQRQLMDYEEKLAELDIQNTLQIKGDNPEINRQTERLELKKACIKLFEREGFDFVSNSNGVLDPPSGVPEPESFPGLDPNSVGTVSKRIRFLEEAFDWKNMSYELYPYFWGRKKNWLDNFAISNPDPVFEQFLKAGSAKVLIPVRPAYTAAVLYYQLTGDIPATDEVPNLQESSFADAAKIQLYNDYINDMKDVVEDDIEKETTFKQSEEGEWWRVKVPTNLVWLQNDEQKLPDYSSQLG